MSPRRSLTERTMPTGKSTAVSSTTCAWFFSATAVLVAALFVALAVLAADFFASVVARLACVLDLLLRAVAAAALPFEDVPLGCSRMARAAPSLANIRSYEHTFLNAVRLRLHGGSTAGLRRLGGADRRRGPRRRGPRPSGSGRRGRAGRRSSSPSPKATAPPASRTISWAAAASTERQGRRLRKASKRPAAT